MTESFELVDESVAVAVGVFGLAADEVVIAEVVVGDVLGEHVPGGDEDRVTGRDRCLLVAAAAAESLVLRGEIGVWIENPSRGLR